jgi:hypothetical protein
VLRECARVLRPAGRLAALVIEAAPELSYQEEITAVELGPSRVLAEASLVDLVAVAGFEVKRCDDVTEEFRATVAAMRRTLLTGEAELREAEGDAAYEEESGKKARMLEGIDSGLLRRTLVLAERR